MGCKLLGHIARDVCCACRHLNPQAHCSLSAWVRLQRGVPGSAGARRACELLPESAPAVRKQHAQELRGDVREALRKLLGHGPEAVAVATTPALRPAATLEDVRDEDLEWLLLLPPREARGAETLVVADDLRAVQVALRRLVEYIVTHRPRY